MLKQEPNWQPLSRLPMLTAHIADGVAQAEEHLALLREGIEQPYRLDEATRARSVRAFTDTRSDLTDLFAPQGERWAAQNPGAMRRREVEAYQQLVARHLELVDQVLAAGEEMKAYTIEALIAKSDLEVGIEAVVRDLTSHRGE